MMGFEMFINSKRPAGIIADVKWDIVALLLFVPLASQNVNRYLGTEPYFHRLGS